MQAGALFLQNRRFGFESKNRSKNHRNLNPKIEEKLKKIVKKRCLKACCFLTSIFLDLGLHFASQVGPKFRVIFVFFEIFCKIGPRWPQERLKSVPKVPQEPPRAPQECPRTPQERPSAPQERPKAAPVHPECTKIHNKFAEPHKSI